MPIHTDVTLACLGNLRRQLLALEAHLGLPKSERVANVERISHDIQALNRELNEMMLDADRPPQS